MKSAFINSLQKRLFWDVDPDTIDETINRRFVIERVLQRGGLDDLRSTIEHYTLPVFTAEAKQIRSLDPMTLAFAACVCNEKPENFRCYASCMGIKEGVHMCATNP